MNITTLIITIYSLFNLNASKESEPVRLQKKEKHSEFDEVCRKLCPYVLVACIVIISVLIVFVLAKYGYMFSTEANHYEHLTQITTD